MYIFLKLFTYSSMTPLKYFIQWDVKIIEFRMKEVVASNQVHTQRKAIFSGLIFLKINLYWPIKSKQCWITAYLIMDRARIRGVFCMFRSLHGQIASSCSYFWIYCKKLSRRLRILVTSTLMSSRIVRINIILL